MDATAKASSRLTVTVVRLRNPRVLIGQPKKILFSVDYLEPNKITEKELANYSAEYQILD